MEVQWYGYDTARAGEPCIEGWRGTDWDVHIIEGSRREMLEEATVWMELGAGVAGPLGEYARKVGHTLADAVFDLGGI
jgi:hypothetical protein